MQQSSSQQLKCYGRRNRAKPVPSTLERGPPAGKDVGAAIHTEELHSAPTTFQEVEVLTHLETPQAGRGRPKKVIGTPKEGDRIPSDVVGKNMPTTRRKSAGRPLASEARKASRGVLTLEESVSEGSSLKTPVKPTDEEMVSVKVEGAFSNGGSEHGKKKIVGSGSTGSRKTRAQLAKEEAQQAVGGDNSDGGGQPKQKDGGQPSHEKNDEGPNLEKKGGGRPNREKKDGGHSSREKEMAATHNSFAARRRLLALQKRQKDELVLSQADKIFLKREFLEGNKDKKGQPKSKEPARPKTHWDFVIEEMTWLAKDFERERKWKLSQAKKVATRVSRSKLDVEARENRRLKEEEQRMRRVASNIAKEVKKFWLKVDKLVSYKQQLQIEERKKKALDKHLDFLLGQTERYSTMLAENLADTTELEPQGNLLLPPVPQDGSGGVGLELAVVSAGISTSGESQKLEGDVRMEFEGGDEDFMLEDEEEQEDDETTLEADEALITAAERKEELSALQRESEFPLEDLLNMYKTMRGTSDSEEEEEDDDDAGNTDGEDVTAEEEFANEVTEMNTSMNNDVVAPSSPERVPEEISPEGDVMETEKSRVPHKSDMDNSNTLAVPQMLDGKGQSDVEGTLKSSAVWRDETTLGPERDMYESPSSGKIKSADEVQEAADRPVSIVDEAVKRSDKEDPFAVEQAGTTNLLHVEDDVHVAVSNMGHLSCPSRPGPLKGGGDLGTLVVELTDRNSEPDGISFQTNSRRRRHPLSAKYVDLGMAREMQDDRDYIPAAMADGNNEDDDERTLEEEERLAREDGEGTIDEIDQLKLENEMSLEELLAKYKSAASDDEGDLDDVPEDRRDRTSEAGTSGSSSNEEDEDDDEDDYGMALGMAEAKERMGEPSTSGRDHPHLLSTGSGKRMDKRQIIDNLEVKQEVVDTKVLEDSQKMELQGRLHEPADVNGWGKNGFPKGASSENVLSATSLLLEADGEVDVETAAAVAKVTQAAKRRGECIVMRASKEDRDILLGNETARMRVGAIREILKDDDNVSLPSTTLVVDEGVDCLSILPSSDVVNSDRMLANGNAEIADLQVDGLSGVPADSLWRSENEGMEDRKNKITELEKHGSAQLENLDEGEEKSSEDTLADFAAAAQSAQPTGYTFSTTKVKTKLPFLLKHSLREYQHIGLDWLVTMYEKRLNGILADEMGLGKTIMTIALLAHLACEKGIWGPHLIVVPTSVMLNWETEFMKWCPAFKILTYFGNAKERKLKRQGWSRPNSFHVCITTYRLVIQDAKAFKRKKWKYLILDEAHLIKNWKSQRWQTLLNFNSKRRILLTGTPLQNDLMELWSLMHFLMPHVFQSHQEFRDWFSNPITGMVEGEEQVNKELVDRLHNVLRPFLLRRLKKDVEKQLPGKFEHVVHCRLSKRQRNLYEDFMASSDTQATLSSGNFLGLINVLMQLRKVCNHPDLFEGRPIISSFDMPGIEVHLSSAACLAMSVGPFCGVNVEALNLRFSQLEGHMTKWEAEEVVTMKTPAPLIVELGSTGEDTWKQHQSKHKPSREVRSVIEEIQSVLKEKRETQRKERVLAVSFLNELRCSQRPLYGADFLKSVEVTHPVYDVHKVKARPSRYLEFSSLIANIVQLPLTRCDNMMDLIAAFVFAIPAARAPLPVAWCSHLSPTAPVLRPSFTEEVSQEASALLVPLRPVVVRRQLFFPDRRLLQFDCGKLQELALLLRRLKSEGHRALIFTQMTKMLDVLESFINLYGYTYMRLDGSTKPEQRQILMQRFNTNPKIFLFILSTRSGGVGINLVGADTVIFYDSDWNPAMDQQAQDRCHRIGQTREVHIYRLVSESTIEENILKKANQKRILDDLVIQRGSYNTEFFKKLDPMELFSGLKGVKLSGSSNKAPGIAGVVAPATLDGSGLSSGRTSEQKELSNAEVEAALRNAEDEADYMAMKRVEQEEAAENQEFTEEVFAGNLDDEDLADDLDEGGKVGQAQTEVVGVAVVLKGDQSLEDGGSGVITEGAPFAESSIIPADVDEEMDMLADVRQMAAAAAASGRGSTSFEDQLRPVERYAMRFLELWDPRADKLAVVAQVAFEEKEWELDQLEKLKEEQEAEIDEDNEPLFYETWDTALADEAYRQQVDILAQQQENQKQLEWEAMEEEMRDADRAVAEAAASVVGAENFVKPKGKKKSKKAKFKSLAEGSLLSDTDDTSVGEEYHPERSEDPPYRDSHSDLLPLPHRSPSQRKRKAPKLLEEEMLVEMHTKKLKKEQSGKDKGTPAEKDKGKKKSSNGSSFKTISGDASEHGWPGAVNQENIVLPEASVSSGKPGVPSGGKSKGGKITMMGMHPKKGPLVMLEKEKKKDFSRSQDQLPPASPWKHGEDAVLCAIVHEYGGNWQLASDALAGIPEGSVYRGRHRHPHHCRERFRQLLAQNAAAASGDPTSEKSALNAATNAQLKVTEEHTKRLLDAVLQHSDDELLLQRHFMAAITAFQNWRKRAAQQASEKHPVGLNSPRGRNFVPLQSLVRFHPLSTTPGSGKVSPLEVTAALAQISREPKTVSNQAAPKPPTKDQASKDQSLNDGLEAFNALQYLEGSLEFAKSSEVEGEKAVSAQSLPPRISLEDFFGFPTSSSPLPPPTSKAVRHSAEMVAENRFRVATRIGWDGDTREWAAAGGSGTGVLGVHVPTKGKGVAKKRPAPDPSKPPKPKQPKAVKPSNKKGGAGDSKPEEASPTSNDPPAQNGEVHGTATASSGLPDASGTAAAEAPRTSQKTGADNSKKKPTHSASPRSQAPPGGLDLNLQQADAPLLDASTKATNSKKAKMSASGPGMHAVEPKSAQKAEKKSKKAGTQSKQPKTMESAAAARVGPGNLGGSTGSPSTGHAGSHQKEPLGERGIDLNDSSDDDLAILGVSPATLGSGFDLSISPMAASLVRSEIARHTSGAEMLGLRKQISDALGGSPIGLGTFSSSGSPASLRGGLKVAAYGASGNEGTNLASHLIRRPDWQTVSGSPVRDHSLTSSVLPKELSQVQWPPAPGVWPVPSFPDLDHPAENMMRFIEDMGKLPPSGSASMADLPSFSFRGQHNPERLSPYNGSPSGQEAGQRPGVMPSSTVSGLQTPEGGGPRRTNSLEDQFQQHADMLDRQHHVRTGGLAPSNSLPQGRMQTLWPSSAPAGNSPHGGNLVRHPIGYASTTSQRPPSTTGAVPLQQHPHPRAHASPSCSVRPPSHFRPSSSNAQMHNHAAFQGFSLQTYGGPESPVDPDLGLSLGPGLPKKQPDSSLPRD